jgi:hypothetical protein
MALRLTRSGDVRVVEKRAPMTDADKLRRRDRRFFMDRLDGYSVAEIAREGGYNRQYVYERLASISAELKRRYLDDHRRLRKLRADDFAEEVESLYSRSG